MAIYYKNVYKNDLITDKKAVATNSYSKKITFKLNLSTLDFGITKDTISHMMKTTNCEGFDKYIKNKINIYIPENIYSLTGSFEFNDCLKYILEQKINKIISVFAEEIRNSK